MRKWVIDNVITPIVLARALAAYRQAGQERNDFEKVGSERSRRAARTSKQKEKPYIG
jgi:hypothetical protein